MDVIALMQVAAAGIAMVACWVVYLVVESRRGK